jgi:hypothetical protein
MEATAKVGWTGTAARTVTTSAAHAATKANRT